jgi:hypothetical protein
MDRQAGRQRADMKPIVTFRNFANTPKTGEEGALSLEGPEEKYGCP